jgi:hypothetical protein
MAANIRFSKVSVVSRMMMNHSAAIAHAISRGIAYLEGVQDPNGEIPVYSAYSPDMSERRHLDPCIFGTAMVASVLADCDAAKKVCSNAVRFLERERLPGGIWGYYKSGHRHHFLPPPDVDDTSMASIALVENGRKPPQNRAVLLASRDHHGMFLTWIFPWGRRFRPVLLAEMLRQLPKLSLYRRMFVESLAARDDADAAVNANVLTWLGPFEGDHRIIDRLIQILRGGHEATCDKYYDDPILVRYLFSRALVGRNAEAGKLLVARSVPDESVSAFHLALNILIRTMWGAAVSEDQVRRLIDFQLSSGEWPIAPVYLGGRTRIAYGEFAPAPREHFRSGSEALTTAFCVSALNAMSVRGSGAAA